MLNAKDKLPIKAFKTAMPWESSLTKIIALQKVFSYDYIKRWVFQPLPEYDSPANM